MAERKRKDGRGGSRAGSGRKKGTKVGPYKGGDHLLTRSDTFRVSEETHRRIAELREATKGDAVPFNRMIESWVAELARDYGID